MKRFFMLMLLLLMIKAGHSQLLQWNTSGNTGLETTEPSMFNNPGINAADLILGPGLSPAANTNRFGGLGWFDAGNTNPSTISEAIAGNNYIEFTITPVAGATFTVTSFSFTWQSSGSGPHSLTLRSSADNFTNNLGTVSFVTTNFGSYSMNISGITNIGTAVTFRLYGYGATGTAGTGGFDQNSNQINVTLNGYTTGGYQTSFFRSAGSGDWNNSSTWESSADGINWTAAATVPDVIYANTIRIRNGHTITIQSATKFDQLIIEAGGQLTITNSATFTLEEGPGVDLICQGTLLNAANPYFINGTMSLSAGGQYIHYTNDDPGKIYSKTTIDPNSTWIYRGSPAISYAPVTNNATYGHLRFESGGGVAGFYPGIDNGNSCHVNDFYIGPDVDFGYGSLFEGSVWTIDGNMQVEAVSINTFGGYFNVNLTGQGKTISSSPEIPVNSITLSGTSSYTLLTNIRLINSTSPMSVVTIDAGATLDAGTYQVTGDGVVRVYGKLVTAHTNGLYGTLTNFTNPVLNTIDENSTIEFNGTNIQDIRTPSYITGYGNVIINGGDKGLSGNVTILKKLYLVSGLVHIFGYDVVMKNTELPSIPVYSATSYIVTSGTGSLKQDILNSGDYVFPVGSATSLEEASINFATPPVGANTLSARFIAGTPGDAGLPLTETGDNINHASVAGYWQITADGPLVNPYTATFKARLFNDITDYTKLHLLKRELPGDDWFLDGTHVPTTGSNALAVLQRTGMSHFSEFAAGGVPAVSLPVTITTFSGYRDGNVNRLKWSTASEIDNRGFEIQRSYDGVNYTVIGFVNSLAAGGNSSSVLSYSFTDQTATGDKQYYRLRQQDLSGGNKLSQVILIRSTAILEGITTLYPNPVRDRLNVLVSSTRHQDLVLTITDMSGKIVTSRKVVAETGSNNFPVNVGGLVSGTYLVRIAGQDNVLPGTAGFIKY